MELEDQFRLLVGGYFGVREVDEYELKVYILKDIENYIRDFIMENPIDIDYLSEANKIEDNVDLKIKFQDALIVLQKINGPMELVFLIKKRLKVLKNK